MLRAGAGSRRGSQECSKQGQEEGFRDALSRGRGGGSGMLRAGAGGRGRLNDASSRGRSGGLRDAPSRAGGSGHGGRIIPGGQDTALVPPLLTALKQATEHRFSKETAGSSASLPLSLPLLPCGAGVFLPALPG